VSKKGKREQGIGVKTRRLLSSETPLSTIFFPSRQQQSAKVVSRTSLGSRGKGGGSTKERGKDNELHGLILNRNTISWN
jgi:hypothetical protein